MSSTTCVLCPVYSAERDVNAADEEQTCKWCRLQLDRDIRAVQAMYRQVLEADTETVDNRRRADGTARDRVASTLPMAPTPPPSKQPRVSGTRERTVPINVRLLDLTAPVRDLSATYECAVDQVGETSVASVLWAWIGRWHPMAFPRQRLPKPRAEAMFEWLIGSRLDTAADLDEQIDLFAFQLRTIRRSLQSLLGDTVPYPAVMWGVPCRRCDLVSTLILDLEDPDHYRECTSCGLLMTEEEYKLWLKEIVEQLRGGK